MQHNSVQERRLALKAILAEQRDVSVATLSESLQVSEATIRRDLADLEAEGELRRTYGGAVWTSSNVYVVSHDQKAALCIEEKARIGRVAAGLVCRGDTLFFDSGTTVMQVAMAIASSIANLGIITAITHSMPVVELLGQVPGVRMIVLGGVYSPLEGANVGPDTIARLRQLEADKVFLGCDSISLTKGLGGPDQLEAEVELIMIEQAREVILVADHTKFDAVVVSPRIPLDRIHTIVTGREAEAEKLDSLAGRGIRVIVA